jgi:DNA topoisomerase-1
MEDRRFKPTDLGYLVNDMLVGSFTDILNVAFTAGMEEKLDDIAQGERPWVPMMREFYDPFAETLERAQREIQHVNQAAELTDQICNKCGKLMAIKLGRFGKFLSCTGYPECKNARPMEETQPEPSDEICETCGKPMQIRTGRYGKFLACTDYPECKTSRPILVKLGKNCPKCSEGELVEKKGRSGRPFYGCARWPACEWVSFARPLPDPCEVCGGLRIPVSGDKVHCIGCDGDLPVRPRKSTDGAASGNGRGRATGGRRTAASSRSTAGGATARAKSTATKSAGTATKRAAAAKATGTAKTSATGKAASAKSRATKTGTAAKGGTARKTPARSRATSASTRAKRAS